MTLFDPGPPFSSWTDLRTLAGHLYKQLVDICQAGNQLDGQNFPNGLPGSVIKTGSLPASAILNRTLPPAKLTLRETHLPLVLLAEAWSTTSTSFVNASGYLYWDPVVFSGFSEVRLEVAGCVANAAATATYQLMGAAAIGSVTTQATSMTRVRSTVLSMPGTAQNLWLQAKTSSGSYAAYLLAARLVLVH